MIAGRKLDTQLKTEFLKGMKIPRIVRGGDPAPFKKKVSHPVIRYEDGKFYLAIFVFFCSQDEILNGMLPRPEYYGLADIENGRIVATRFCRDNDFSTAKFDKKYRFDMSEIEKDTSEEYFDKLFSLLDDARQYIQETNNPAVYMRTYNEYLDMLLKNIPSGYRRFYKELSRPEPPKQELSEFNYTDFSDELNLSPDAKKMRGKKYAYEKNHSGISKDMRNEDEKRKQAVIDVLGAGAAKSDNDSVEMEKKINTGKKNKEKETKTVSENSDGMQKSNCAENSQQKSGNASQSSIKPEGSENNGNNGAENSVFFSDDEGIDETVAIDPAKMEAVLREIRQERENRETKKTPQIKKNNDAKAELQNNRKSAPNKSNNKRYYFRDITWEPSEDLSILPERYFKIAERISDHIEFLDCEKPVIRFSYPMLCFESDSVPGTDPWQIMQLKVLNSKLDTGHYRINPAKSIYTLCSHRERCLFNTCPYVIAAYIKYLKLVNPELLSAQRADYYSSKDEMDAEGNPGYDIKPPEKAYKQSDIDAAIRFINAGLLNISRKKGTSDRFVITYVSNGKEGIPAIGMLEEEHANIKSISSFCIDKNNLENGLSKNGYFTRTNGKKTPDGVDVMIWVDYLIRTKQLNSTISPNTHDSNVIMDDEMVTISF